MLKSTTLFVGALLLVGCNASSTQPHEEEITTQPPTYEETSLEDSTAITTLNNLRESIGLNKLTQNQLLDNSALNHATYLNDNNLSGHIEEENKESFTGINPVDRTTYVGYKSQKILENVSVGQEDETASIDGLMGAIYHRIAFLAFDIDEIGYGDKNKHYVYNMGNSKLNTLCDKESFDGVGVYYTNVCSDKDFKIEYNTYNTALSSVALVNPSLIVYPYNNQTNVTPVFYEESPDPLPNQSVSAIPISVAFNSYDFNTSKLTVENFELHNQKDELLELVLFEDGDSILKETNDINHEFSPFDFAIFPKQRLDYNTTYSAQFTYTYDNKSFTKKWSFTTKSLPNLITYNNETLHLNLATPYYVYLKPLNENDTIAHISVRCSYQSGGDVDIDTSLHDQNTIKLEVNGRGVESCRLSVLKSDNSTQDIELDF